MASGSQGPQLTTFVMAASRRDANHVLVSTDLEPDDCTAIVILVQYWSIWPSTMYRPTRLTWLVGESTVPKKLLMLYFWDLLCTAYPWLRKVRVSFHQDRLSDTDFPVQLDSTTLERDVERTIRLDREALRDILRTGPPRVIFSLKPERTLFALIADEAQLKPDLFKRSTIWHYGGFNDRTMEKCDSTYWATYRVCVDALMSLVHITRMEVLSEEHQQITASSAPEYKQAFTHDFSERVDCRLQYFIQTMVRRWNDHIIRVGEKLEEAMKADPENEEAKRNYERAQRTFRSVFADRDFQQVAADQLVILLPMRQDRDDILALSSIGPAELNIQVLRPVLTEEQKRELFCDLVGKLVRIFETSSE